jgi:drug/metabolite transporter (DMT)-like permease
MWNSEMTGGLSPRSALALLAIVVLAWGTNWPVTKMIVRDLPPLWSTAVRCAIAAVVLAPLLWAQGMFIIPRRGDMPVVLCTSLLHMVGFSALAAAGLQFIPAGRAIVLGYTTPIWVALGARIFLGERMTKRRAIGIGVGLAGLAVIFEPRAFNWNDQDALLGSGLILVAGVCWAANIVYIRAHVWISTPFQLVIWQVLLAAAVLSTIAFFKEGTPHIEWSASLVGLLLYSGIICTALAHWAMTMVNRSLPAVTTSLCLLATPVVGIFSASIALNESLEPSLFLAMALIVGGIVIGTVTGDRKATAVNSDSADVQAVDASYASPRSHHVERNAERLP